MSFHCRSRGNVPCIDDVCRSMNDCAWPPGGAHNEAPDSPEQGAHNEAPDSPEQGAHIVRSGP